jgi:HEAT repeat protein
VRRYAAIAIGKIGPAAQASVPALTVVLRGDTSGARTSAAIALSKMGTRGLEQLIEVLRDDMDSEVRGHAALALGSFDPPLGRAVLPLTQALANDNDPTVRLIAASSLGEIGPRLPAEARSAQLALHRALEDPDKHVSEQAQHALTKFPSPLTLTTSKF